MTTRTWTVTYSIPLAYLAERGLPSAIRTATLEARSADEAAERGRFERGWVVYGVVAADEAPPADYCHYVRRLPCCEYA